MPNKTCPYCAETIKAEAILCKFCHRSVQEQQPASVSHEEKRQNQTISDIVICLAAVLAIVGCFRPWMSGEWLGGDIVTYAGYDFFTSYLGIAAVLLQVGLLLVTLAPLVGHTVAHRETLRLIFASQSVILVLAAYTVLEKIIISFSRMEIGYGIYMALVGAVTSFIFTLMRFQQERRFITRLRNV